MNERTCSHEAIPKRFQTHVPTNCQPSEDILINPPRLFSARVIAVYLLLLVIPFSFPDIGGPTMPYIRLYEIFALLGLMMAFLSGGAATQQSIQWNAIDLCFVAYIFSGLLSMLFGMDQIYVSARDYRNVYISSLLVYLAVQFCFENRKQIFFSFWFFVVALITQLVIVLPNFFRTFERPEGIPLMLSLVTLATLAAWMICYLLCVAHRNEIYSTSWWKSALLLPPMLLLLLITYRRAALYGLFAALPISYAAYRIKLVRKCFVPVSVILLISFFFTLVFANPTMFKGTRQEQNMYESSKRTFERLTSVPTYIADIKMRMQLWNKCVRDASNTFIGALFGNGQDAYRSYGLSTPHNIFVSMFVTSGIIGLVTFAILNFSLVHYLLKIHLFHDNEWLGIFLLCCYLVLFFVSATNDFSGGRNILFGVLLAVTSKYVKLTYVEISALSACAGGGMRHG